jgi:predicted RNase H-like HicB family nuclease
MKLRLIVEKDPETGRYSSVFPELPGCASAGDTEDEAIASAEEALALWFEPSEIPVPETARLLAAC